LDPSFFDFDIGEPLTKEELKGAITFIKPFVYYLIIFFLQCVYMKRLQGQKMMIDHLYFFQSTHNNAISRIFFFWL